jgi:hypothetical protein
MTPIILAILFIITVLVAFRLYIHRWWKMLSDEKRTEITKQTQRIPGDW